MAVVDEDPAPLRGVIMELYKFGTNGAVWLPHPAKEGKGNCFGRIVRLSYPWKWDTIYCDRPCCKRDLNDGSEESYFMKLQGDDPRHIAATLTHYDPTDFYWCMDCGRVGTKSTVGSGDAPKTLLGVVERLDDGRGARWKDVEQEGEKLGIGGKEADEVLNNLLDAGLLCEPVLGRLKVIR